MGLSWDSAALRYLRAAIVLMIVVYAIFIEPFNLEVTENAFDLFEGDGDIIKAVLIADAQDMYNHHGYEERVVDAINAQGADIIFIAGDIVEVGDDWDRIDRLGALESRYGTYAILGNHDYYCLNPQNCSDKVEAKLESMGILVLRNEHLIMSIKGHEFALIGVDDLWSGQSNYRLASATVPENMTKVILAHNQYSLTQHSLQGRNLILSGHTHCGLVQIPYLTDFAMKQSRFADVGSGHAVIDNNTDLYVTCGLTPGGVRLFTRPEISVIYLE